MNALKSLFVGLVLLGSLAAPALADGGDFNQGMIVVVTGTGTAQKKVTDDAFLNMATKDVTPLAAGSMIVMHNGKVYIVADKKMADGHMMSERVLTFQ